jgi:hypothetical protein
MIFSVLSIWGAARGVLLAAKDHHVKYVLQTGVTAFTRQPKNKMQRHIGRRHFFATASELSAQGK